MRTAAILKLTVDRNVILSVHNCEPGHEFASRIFAAHSNDSVAIAISAANRVENSKSGVPIQPLEELLQDCERVFRLKFRERPYMSHALHALYVCDRNCRGLQAAYAAVEGVHFPVSQSHPWSQDCLFAYFIRGRERQREIPENPMCNIAPNLLDRQLPVAQPNQAWVGAMTFIATRKGWLFFAVMLDLYSRKVIGWSMSTRNNKQLVKDCLLMSIHRRKPSPGPIHHTDVTPEQFEINAAA